MSQFCGCGLTVPLTFLWDTVLSRFQPKADSQWWSAIPATLLMFSFSIHIHFFLSLFLLLYFILSLFTSLAFNVILILLSILTQSNGSNKCLCAWKSEWLPRSPLSGRHLPSNSASKFYCILFHFPSTFLFPLHVPERLFSLFLPESFLQPTQSRQCCFSTPHFIRLYSCMPGCNLFPHRSRSLFFYSALSLSHLQIPSHLLCWYWDFGGGVLT